MSAATPGDNGESVAVLFQGRVRDELVVKGSDIVAGDWLHLGKDLWVCADNYGSDDRRTLVWCRGLYYPVAIDKGALATIRRAAASGSRDGSDG